MSWVPSTPIPTTILESIYNGSGLARRIVNAHPWHATRRGITFPGRSDLDRRWQRAGFLTEVTRACRLARLFGGSLIVIGAADGGAEAPLAGVDGVRWIRAYGSNRVTAEGVVDLDAADRFRVTRRDGRSVVVHRSRAIVVRGEEATDDGRAARGGWDVPILEIVYETLADLNGAFKAAGSMMQRASEGVLTMRHLLESLATDSALVQARAEALRIARSVAGVMLLEEGETYTNVSASFGGIPEVLDRVMSRLSADTGIPVQILFGESPGGLNATGEAPRGSWDETVAAWRSEVIDPIVRRLLEVDGNGDAEHEWPAMREPTATERAALAKVEAEIDAIRISSGVTTPEDVAELRGIATSIPSSFADPLPAGIEVVDAEAAEGAISAPSTLAARMSELGADRCPHGRSNRCPLCGVEREWTVDRDETGSIVYRGAWRATSA
jgi:phage-related protein (TIGR01555 family)